MQSPCRRDRGATSRVRWPSSVAHSSKSILHRRDFGPRLPYELHSNSATFPEVVRWYFVEIVLNLFVAVGNTDLTSVFKARNELLLRTLEAAVSFMRVTGMYE